MILTFLSVSHMTFAKTQKASRQTEIALREQVKVLTERMEALERKLVEQDRGEDLVSLAKPAEPSASVAPVKNDSSNSVPASKPNSNRSDSMSIKLPNTNTSLELGGYVKLDAIYNSESVGGSGGTNSGDEVLLPGTIPVNPVAGESDQITFHARQSRIWLKSLTPSDLGDLSTYLEMDFFAFQAPGDERVSNSYSPSMRHAYGQLGHFLAGQTWSTFMEPQALPELNDFGGPVGRIFVRQSQIRWTQPIELGGYAMAWNLAIESPETTVSTPTGARETPDDDRMPDVIGRLSLSQPWGTLSLAAMLRNIRMDASTVNSHYGGALNIAGKVNTFEQDDVRFMLAYGNALGRYSSSNLFNDAVMDNTGNIHLLNSYSGYAAYQHWWNRKWRSTLACGLAFAENPSYVANNVSNWAQSTQVNVLWSPVNRTTFGIEYTYAARTIESGAQGDLQRFQFSAMFQF
ncbi:hypothetical protein A1353_06000 [Methylomonas methanica]|uniref:Porin n=2 Tax=Methylomonas methanica TaxID=421 RepID=A0A177MS35_METMH|nr:hypothetical protein A1353_06000 [Methylomonas methanica]